jgi:hypothetical protein
MTIKDNPTATALGVMRTAVGINSWLSPRLVGRTFGLGDAGDDERAALITRLFGVRDATLGQAVMLTDGETRRLALTMGAVCDGIDVIASLIALRKGVSKAGIILVGGGAALFLGLGLAALAQESRAPQ